MSARQPHTIRLVEERWTTIRHIVEAVAIVAAGLWAFYTFVYQEKIKPAQEPAAVSLSVQVRRLGRDARRDILSVDINIHNTGKTEIDVAGDAMNVWGERFGNRDVAFSRGRNNYREFVNQIPILSKRLVDAFFELREAAEGGRPSHIIIEPGATETLQNLIVIPRGKYDVLRAEAIIVPVKTPVKTKLRVLVQHLSYGGVWLSPTDSVEDDISTDFALIP